MLVGVSTGYILIYYLFYFVVTKLGFVSYTVYMNKKVGIFLVIIIVFFAVVFFVQKKVANTGTPQPIQALVDNKNLTYAIDGQSVRLVAGRAETPSAPGSASMTVTQYFGNEAIGDVNGDGMNDTAFLVTQNSGGSGTFFYVLVALKTATGYQGTNAVLLGDRIAPQTTEIKNGEVVVNYADRNSGEPMTTRPSLGVTKYLTVSGAVLSEKK